MHATAASSRHLSRAFCYRIVTNARFRKKDFLRCFGYFPFGLIVWLCARQLSWRCLPSLLLSTSSSCDFERQQQRRLDNHTSSASPENLSRKGPWIFPVSNSQDRNLSLVVAQYASSKNNNYDSNRTVVTTLYDDLLQMTSHINQAYCRAWKCDYWIVRGIPFQVDDEQLVVGGRIINRTTTRPSLTSGEIIPASRSTYNKVAILEMALWHNQQSASAATTYDRLLLLDADALLYDFDNDIAMAVPYDRVFTAHQTHHNTTITNSGSINVGVTVWNLRHPLTPLIVQAWKRQCLRRIRQHKHDDDQAPLQKILQQIPNDEQRNHIVYAVTDKLGYAKGHWVRHYIRRSNAWHDDNQTSTNNSNALRGEGRTAQISQAVSDVCQRYWPVCESDNENDNKQTANIDNAVDGTAI